MKVYTWKNEVVFEGDIADVKDFIFNQAYKMADGRIIYRTWNEDNKYFYDVGRVFYTLESLED